MSTLIAELFAQLTKKRSHLE